MRRTCVNPQCRDELVKWKPTGVYNGWEKLPREGKYLCLSCKYLAKWVFGIAVFVGGILGSIIFKVLTKLGWL